MGIHEFAEHDPQVEVSQVMGVPPIHYRPSSYWGPPFKDSPKCPYPCAVAHSEGLPSRCASNLVFLVISVLGSKGQMGTVRSQ